jgi:hypothetical protein
VSSALATLSAAAILSIPPGHPERLFSGDAKSLRGEFASLARRWHPDRNAGSEEAAAVFARVVELHKDAAERLAGGRWIEPDALRIDTIDGRAFRFAFKRRHALEIGEMLISPHHVVFVVGKPYAALFRQGIRRIAGVTYADAKVKGQIARFIPHLERTLETADAHVAVARKTEDVVLLKDLLDYLGGGLPPKHAAWVVSALLNLVCFFEVTGLTHNALSANSVFVSAKFHAVFPLGGWWYAAPVGTRINVLPEETFALAPAALLAKKQADTRLDLESVRAIGRACLNDPSGLALAGRPDVPAPMSQFLRLPSSGSAVEDYRTWTTEVLPDSFGPRRFLELPITPSDVYP